MAANSRKQRGKPFQPGQSGNPSGRPKEVGHIKELARQHTDAAIKTLVEALKDGNKRTAVAAAEVLLDRGWGKATQFVEANVNVFDRLNPEQQAALETALEHLARDESGDAGGAARTTH